MIFCCQCISASSIIVEDGTGSPPCYNGWFFYFFQCFCRSPHLPRACTCPFCRAKMSASDGWNMNICCMRTYTSLSVTAVEYILLSTTHSLTVFIITIIQHSSSSTFIIVHSFIFIHRHSLYSSSSSSFNIHHHPHSSSSIIIHHHRYHRHHHRHHHRHPSFIIVYHRP